MSYLNFLLVFLIPPIGIGGYYFMKHQSENKKDIFLGTALLVFVAVAYTTPWDNYLVKTNVWWYGLDRVIGTIGYVPVEEYCFFVLQSVMTGLWFFYLDKKLAIDKQGERVPSQRILKNLGAALLLGFLTLGIYGFYEISYRYLGLILTWSVPVLLLQWLLGGEHILKNLKIYTLAIFCPTVYLCIADAFAISNGIWKISENQTLGFKIGSLPLEEASFFLVTNGMLVQGLLLFVILKKKYLGKISWLG